MEILRYEKFVNENYPLGAKNDPNAPWNQSDSDIEQILNLTEYGEIQLITRTYISREPDNEDWEDEITTIDPGYMDYFLANKLNLNVDEYEDGIEIHDTKELKDSQYIIKTTHGDVETDWDELEYISTGKDYKK